MVNNELIKDDLYMAVNGDWLKTAKIPADKAATGGFYDLADDIEKTLMEDFANFMTGEAISDDKCLNEFIKYYRLVSNFEKRNADGFKPAKQYFDKITSLKDINDWQEKLYDLTMMGLPNPFPLYVEPDMKDTQHYALYASVPSLILPDKTYYEENHPQAEAFLNVYRQMVLALFERAGYDNDFAQVTLEKALAFDKSLAPVQKDSTERADYAKSYNKYSFEDYTAFSKSVDLGAFAKKLIDQTPDQVIVDEPKYYEALETLINPDTFENFKSWLLVKTLISVSTLLDDDTRVLAGTYSRALSGSKEAMKAQKAAFYLATGQFSQVVGLYYAHKYFGAKAKADVHHMVEKMIDVYKNRLASNDWLSDDTHQKAIVKLNTLGINVGYPDKLDPLYTKFVVDEDADLVTNDLNFTQISLKEHYGHWGKDVDRSRWEMPAHMVNAYYNPSFNIIVFPAAILQAPFYSLDQSSSENFGGIGAVIAHEISHAFDNNGAQFDEFGNLHNWWTDEDLKHFQGLAQDMIAEFDGLETEAGKVNGKLVVSENIADAGGLSCALEAAKSEPDVDLKACFINWARIWRMKSSIERQKLLLSIDVHAPHVLRANVQPKNLADFYTTFGITSDDKMYLAPEKRVNIW